MVDTHMGGILGLILFAFTIYIIFAILHTHKLTTENHDMLEELLKKANRNSTTGTQTMEAPAQTIDAVPAKETIGQEISIEQDISIEQNIDHSNW